MNYKTLEVQKSQLKSLKKVYASRSNNDVKYNNCFYIE